MYMWTTSACSRSCSRGRTFAAGHGRVVPDAPSHDDAFIAVFLLPLPDALPVPHGSTWTRQLDEREPLLDGVDLRPLAHLERAVPLPSDAQGHNFVSLRFWRVKDDQAAVPEFTYRTLLAARVGKALNPDVQGDPDDFAKIPLEDYEPYRTIVEAVTFVACDEQLVASEGKPDPLTRCIDVLTGFHRSYRVQARKHISELTYERLHPVVICFRRPLFGDALPMPAGMIMLENRNFAVPDTEPLSQEMQRDISLFSIRASAGDPFAIYAERRLEAEMEVWTTGRMGESVLQCGIAAEVLFDALLGLMMWEEHQQGSLTVYGAAEVFSSDITPRLRSEYAKRLGGQWSFQSEPMSGWFNDITHVRNRVVHGGYRPDKHKAADALDALLAVEKFVGDRLAERWLTYPRTAWLFLGTSGFEKRGGLRRADAWLQENGANTAPWVREYRGWREQVDALVARRRQA